MNSLILPYQPLQPSATNILAQRLQTAIDALPDLGVKISPSSRLPLAVKLLQRYAEDGAYPTANADLIRAGNAIKCAFNFVRVADAVTPPGPPGVVEALRRAVKGTLDDTGPTDAHRAQSELVIGIATVAGGAKVATPQPGGGKTPDFVADVDTLRFSLEVKRPRSLNSVEDRVSEAVSQIRDYMEYPGAVALDLSDILPAVAGVSDIDQADAYNQETFRHAYAIASALIDRRYEEEGWSRIGVLGCFAESLLWTQPNPSPLPHGALMMYMEVFHHASHGLIVDQSRRLRQCTAGGFEELGARLRYVTRTPGAPAA